MVLLNVEAHSVDHAEDLKRGAEKAFASLRFHIGVGKRDSACSTVDDLRSTLCPASPSLLTLSPTRHHTIVQQAQ
jgi:hypothetical protein